MCVSVCEMCVDMSVSVGLGVRMCMSGHECECACKHQCVNMSVRGVNVQECERVCGCECVGVSELRVMSVCE